MLIFHIIRAHIIILLYAVNTLHKTCIPIKVGTLYTPHCYKNRKKKWARSKKKDKNKCPFFKSGNFSLQKNSRFLHLDANAANSRNHFFGMTA